MKKISTFNIQYLVSSIQFSVYLPVEIENFWKDMDCTWLKPQKSEKSYAVLLRIRGQNNSTRYGRSPDFNFLSKHKEDSMSVYTGWSQAIPLNSVHGLQSYATFLIFVKIFWIVGKCFLKTSIKCKQGDLVFIIYAEFGS